MEQKTFTQYLKRPYGAESLVAEAERKSRRAAEAYGAYENATQARQAARAAFDASEGPGPETRAYVAAEERKNKKYYRYRRAADAEYSAAVALKNATRPRREAAARFDPQDEETVLDYATTAYPSRRGAEMGLQCPVFGVRVRATRNSVRAYAIRSDGKVMGTVAAQLTSMGDTPLVAVFWSSLLEGGESLSSGMRGPTDFRGCGIGPRLYEAIAEYACKNNRKMASDTTLYPNSRAFWERQEEKGRAYFDGGKGRFIVIDACGIRSTGMRGLGKSKSKKRRKG